MSSFVEIVNLSKSFYLEKEQLDVFSNINLSIEEGEFLVILGASGCGKSTFIRCIGGFEKATTGEVFINGVSITKPTPSVSMVFQSFDQLFPWKTVYENILYPLEVNNIGSSSSERNDIVMYYMDMVGLSSFKDYYPHHLSGGMKQRVAIARSLSQTPSVILMDEPFASLDADTRISLRKELLDIWYKANSKITIFFITHSIIEAISIADKFMVMKKGDKPVILSNNVTSSNNLLRTPEDKGFNECWTTLNQLIRG